MYAYAHEELLCEKTDMPCPVEAKVSASEFFECMWERCVCKDNFNQSVNPCFIRYSKAPVSVVRHAVLTDFYWLLNVWFIFCLRSNLNKNCMNGKFEVLSFCLLHECYLVLWKRAFNLNQKCLGVAAASLWITDCVVRRSFIHYFLSSRGSLYELSGDKQTRPIKRSVS